MVITHKDIIYLVGYLITFITLFLSLKNDQRYIKKQIKIINDVIFADKGSLNLIDQRTLDRHLDHIWTRMRQTEASMNMILAKMDDLKEDTIEIKLKVKLLLNGKAEKENDVRERD